MKDAYYFSHDNNARNDPKILAMRNVYKSEGYGWFWIIIEILREQEGYKLKINNKHIFAALAMQMQCDVDTAKKFVMDCINEFELFETDGEYFWSNSLIRRMAQFEEKSKKAKKAAEARWGKTKENQGMNENKKDSNTNAMQEQCNSNTIKENKIKENKIKEKENKRENNNLSKENLLLNNENENKILNNSLSLDEFNNKDVIELCKYYEQLRPGESISSHFSKLQILIQEYGIDWVKEALETTIKNKNKFILSYMEGILKNWQSEGKEDTYAPNKRKNKSNNPEDEVIYDFSKYGG